MHNPGANFQFYNIGMLRNLSKKCFNFAEEHKTNNTHENNCKHKINLN